MIRVHRTDEPPHIRTSEAQNRYSHQSVIDALWRMQNRKCCYCERLIERTGPEKEVEHFRPRVDFANLTNDWNNLLLACRACNNKKSSQFPTDERGEPLLIDPSRDEIDPEDNLKFVFDLDDPMVGSVHARNESRRGEVTINIIGLAGSSHITQRNTHLIEIMTRWVHLVVTARSDRDPAEVDQAKANFEALLSARAPFAALAREFARSKRLDEEFGVNIPGGAEV